VLVLYFKPPGFAVPVLNMQFERANELGNCDVCVIVLLIIKCVCVFVCVCVCPHTDQHR
jgi:hypothetical protein